MKSQELENIDQFRYVSLLTTEARKLYHLLQWRIEFLYLEDKDITFDK